METLSSLQTEQTTYAITQRRANKIEKNNPEEVLSF